MLNMATIMEYISGWIDRFGSNALKYALAIENTIKDKSFKRALETPRNATIRSYINREHLKLIDTDDLRDIADFICGDHFTSNEELEVVGNERPILCDILRDEWNDRF